MLFCSGNGAGDQCTAQKRPRRIVDENEIRRGRAQRLKPGAHRSLAGGSAGNRRQHAAETGSRRQENLSVVRMNDRLHLVDFGVAKERGEGRADHRFAREFTILLRHFPASAISAPGCDDNRRDFRRHENRLHSYAASL